MNITITQDGITPALSDALKKVRDNRDLMFSLGTLVANFAKDAFRNQDKRPRQWAPLRPATVRRKGMGTRPLIDKGVLVRSPRVVAFKPGEALVGSDRKVGTYSLAAIHHYGAPRAHIPARPFFPFYFDGTPMPSLQRQAEGIVKRWLKKIGFA